MYKVSADVGCGHKVLGKTMNTSILTENELHKLTDLPSIDIGKSTVYQECYTVVLYTIALRPPMTLSFLLDELELQKLAQYKSSLVVVQKTAHHVVCNLSVDTSLLSQLIKYIHLIRVVKQHNTLSGLDYQHE